MTDKVILFPPLKEINALVSGLNSSEGSERYITMKWEKGKHNIDIEYECEDVKELLGALDIIKLQLINDSYNWN